VPPAAAPFHHRSYRALYILNWVYRYLTEKHYKQWAGAETGGAVCFDPPLTDSQRACLRVP
jgi:hypothetical protein